MSVTEPPPQFYPDSAMAEAEKRAEVERLDAMLRSVESAIRAGEERVLQAIDRVRRAIRSSCEGQAVCDIDDLRIILGLVTRPPGLTERARAVTEAWDWMQQDPRTEAALGDAIVQLKVALAMVRG